MSIGERIALLRNEQNISQGALAQALEVSRQAVSKWENDLASPDTMKLIRLAEVLDTDVEYLATGRKSYGRRPPIVVTTVEMVEKVIEKPVYIEKIVETTVEKPVVQYVEKPVIQYIEKPVVKRVFRIKYRRNLTELAVIGVIGFLLGLILGYFL